LAEDPTRISVALGCYIAPDAVRPWDRVDQVEAARKAAEERVRGALTGVKRRLFDAILRRARAYVVTRDKAAFHLQRAWPILRSALHELGRRLSDRALLDKPEDVFFLQRDELWAAGPRTVSWTSADVRARRERWASDNARVPPPAIPPLGDPAWKAAMRWPVNLRELLRSDVPSRVVLGTPASPGRVRARARVLGFASEFARLQPGEALVAIATTPDWTPLFARASAVVTDVGAVTSHSSVVAREYGIPAVVGTQDGTRRIADGQVITIDGSRGEVYLE